MSEEQVSKPRRPRRRQEANESVAESKDSVHAKVDEKPDKSQEEEKKPTNTGWGDGGNKATASEKDDDEEEVLKPTRSSRRKAAEQNAQKSQSKHKHFDDDETTDLMEIPDLEEEEHEEDITTQVAAAPRNNTRKIQSLQELNQSLQYSLPVGKSNGIDFSLLSSALCPQLAVNEGDEIWEFETLLQSLSQSLQSEQDANLIASKKMNRAP